MPKRSLYFVKCLLCYGLAILFYAPTQAQTQTPFFLNYSVSRGTDLDRWGLPSSEAYCVIQDKRGYIWVSTDAGVVRYDGYHFKLFTTQDGLTDNTVFGLHEDDRGRMWCRTLSARLCYFDSEKQRFFSLPCNEALQKMVGYRSLYQIEVDSRETIWLVDSDMRQIKIESPYKPENISLVSFKKNEAIYLVKKHKKTLVGMNPALHSGFYDAIKIVDKDGVHEIQIGGSIYSHNRVGERGDTVCFSFGPLLHIIENYKMTRSIDVGASIIALNIDHRGRIWVGTIEKGIYVFSPGQTKKEEALRFFENESVSDIYEDNEKGIWFTTLKNGLFYFPYPDAVINYSDMRLLDNTKVYTVKKVGDKILAGKSNGDLMVIDPRDFKCRIIPFEGKKQPIAIKTPRITPGAILNIEQVDSNIVFIQGSYTYAYKVGDYSKKIGFGVIRRSSIQDGTRGKSIYFLFERPQFKHLPVENMYSRLLCKLNKDTLFTGGSNSLNFFRKGTNSVQYVIEFTKGRINSVCVSPYNHIWIGATNGLYLLKDTNYTYYGDRYEVFKNRIEYLHALKDGRLLLATKALGLLIWNPSDPGRIDTVSTQNGLASNTCRYIFEENDSIIWVSTNRGLSQLNIKTKQVYRNYTMNDGLPSNEINASYVDSKQIWIASSHGLTCINRKESLENKAPPRIYISSVKLNDTLIATYHSSLTYIYQCPDIEYNPQRLIVDFVGLSYKLPGSCTYLYRIKELQNKWTETSNTSIEFNFLSPGNYHLEIYAVSPAGIKSNFPAFLEFRVLAPFWQKAWFIVVVIVLFALLLFLLFRHRLNLVRAREAKNATLNRTLLNLKLKALRAQMNPHFTFNVMNSIQHFILEKDEESAQRYLSKFSKLIRIILQHSEEENIPLAHELRALELYLELEQMRFENSFHYTIVIDPSIDTDYTRIPSMLIQPYVENAIKHGIAIMEGKGKISITIENRVQELMCVIEDNGVGRAAAAEIRSNMVEYRSFGTSITKERLSVINAIHNVHLTEKVIDLTNEAGEPLGTRVEIHIPTIK